MALCLKVAKKDAQKALAALREKGAFCGHYEVGRGGAYVYLPIRASGKEWAAKLGFGPVVKKNLQAARKRPKSLHDELGGVLSPAELEHVLSSFDVLGDIAMLEIGAELEAKEKEIAGAIMRLYPHVKTVVKKTEGTGGPYRIRPVSVIAGEKKTRTISKENGYSLAVDLNKAYYNPRMASERMRVVRQIKKDETVLVLFAGVGPYAIAAEKKTGADAKPAQIVAIELNPQAVGLMRKNIRLNKCRRIEAIEGDVAGILADAGNPGSRFHSFADRIIMPHPTEALRFLPLALKAAKAGANIHLYAFGRAGKAVEEVLEEAQKIASKEGYSLILRAWRAVQTYSPALVQVVLDLQVRPIS
jgi:tRNA (guanine37-N1)-methyltransferase